VCREEAIAKAVRDVNRPTLASVYAERRGTARGRGQEDRAAGSHRVATECHPGAVLDALGTHHHSSAEWTDSHKLEAGDPQRRHTAMMADPLVYIVGGLLAGIMVGLTGVGGGSLMTPVLILVFGQSPTTG